MTKGNGRRISGPDDFNKALAELLQDAVLNGMEVEGGWDVSANGDDDIHEFAVEIYRIDD